MKWVQNIFDELDGNIGVRDPEVADEQDEELERPAQRGHDHSRNRGMGFKQEHQRVTRSLLDDGWMCDNCANTHFVIFEPDHNSWRLSSTLMIRCTDCDECYIVPSDYREHRRGQATERVGRIPQ